MHSETVQVDFAAAAVLAGGESSIWHQLVGVTVPSPTKENQEHLKVLDGKRLRVMTLLLGCLFYGEDATNTLPLS